MQEFKFEAFPELRNCDSEKSSFWVMSPKYLPGFQRSLHAVLAIDPTLKHIVDVRIFMRFLTRFLKLVLILGTWSEIFCRNK